MLLYVIRHGEPDYTTDTLTELGVKQAELLSERLAPVKFDRIFSSPLGRAKQTAMPTCIKQNKEFEILPWLSENLAYNAMVADIEGKKDWWFAIQNTKYRMFEDAQKYAPSQSQVFCDSFAVNFDNFLSELGYEKCNKGYQITANKYERIAFFCHDGISKVLLSYALSIPFHVFCASFSIPHTGVTVLNFATTKDNLTAPRCLVLSDLSHLHCGKMKNAYSGALHI